MNVDYNVLFMGSEALLHKAEKTLRQMVADKFPSNFDTSSWLFRTIEPNASRWSWGFDLYRQEIYEDIVEDELLELTNGCALAVYVGWSTTDGMAASGFFHYADGGQLDCAEYDVPLYLREMIVLQELKRAPKPQTIEELMVLIGQRAEGMSDDEEFDDGCSVCVEFLARAAMQLIKASAELSADPAVIQAVLNCGYAPMHTFAEKLALDLTLPPHCQIQHNIDRSL